MPETFRGPASSPNCATCPCAENGNPVRPVRGSGSLKSLAIVGDHPSTEEYAQGWPFIGQAGKLLQQALNNTGIDRHTIWLTNATLCTRPKSDALAKQAIECCKPRLALELGLVQPSAVLLLGEDAASAIELPVTAIKSARGTIQQSATLAEVPCVTTIHPAAILKGGGAGVKGGQTTTSAKSKMNVDAQYVFIEADLAKAYLLACNPAQPLWQDNIELIIQPDNVSCAAVMQLCEETKLLSIDLEWDKDDKITWVGVANADKAYSIYLPAMDGMMRAILARAGQLPNSKLFHNLQADVPMWESQIGPLHGTFEDTMLLHHAAYPGAAHDLQNVATQFLLVPPWKANRKYEEKAAAKEASAAKKAVVKADKKANHCAHNAGIAAAAAERKASRVQAHNARNAAAKKPKLSTEDIIKLMNGGN